jgi:hypothetical protein
VAEFLRSIVQMILLSQLIVTPPAQEPARPEQGAAVQADIFSYGAADKTCMRWTDGCRNCSRGTGASPDCSNIGIACQPQDKVTCFGRTPDAPKN